MKKIIIIINKISLAISIVSVVSLLLVAVAYITGSERKLMGFGQRRVGPNKIGKKGWLQPFADALKLHFKEIILPKVSYLNWFRRSSKVNLISSFTNYIFAVFAEGVTLRDLHMGLLYILSISSVGGIGTLGGGWAANSKYTRLGAIRSIAQFLSYELIISTSVIHNILIAGSLSLSEIIESQRKVWSIFTLYPVYNFFFSGSLAETNRTPYDLPEAESELVSGYMTEHSGVVFVFYFLGEYASISLMSLLSSTLYMGGYLIPKYLRIFVVFAQDIRVKLAKWLKKIIREALTMGTKGSMIVYSFISARGISPRESETNLLSQGWTIHLPILFALIFVYLLLMASLDAIPGITSSYFVIPFARLFLRPKIAPAGGYLSGGLEKSWYPI